MELNLRKIAKAWFTAANPTPQQRELAERRMDICNSCDKKGTTAKIIVCTQCGCPLSKKIFTMENDACPLNKWLEVEKDYFKSKTQKSLI
jgi:ribosomal protein L37E